VRPEEDRGRQRCAEDAAGEDNEEHCPRVATQTPTCGHAHRTPYRLVWGSRSGCVARLESLRSMTIPTQTNQTMRPKDRSDHLERWDDRDEPRHTGNQATVERRKALRGFEFRPPRRVVATFQVK
jgi:hypothetical protein